VFVFKSNVPNEPIPINPLGPTSRIFARTKPSVSAYGCERTMLTIAIILTGFWCMQMLTYFISYKSVLFRFYGTPILIYCAVSLSTPRARFA
jgi:hypothetical protein